MPKSIGSYLEKNLRTKAHSSSIGAPLSVVLDTIGVIAQIVEVWVKSNGAATFRVYNSQDGITYRESVSNEIELTASGEDYGIFYNAYRFIRVATAAANDNEIEIVAQR